MLFLRFFPNDGQSGGYRFVSRIGPDKHTYESNRDSSRLVNVVTALAAQGCIDKPKTDLLTLALAKIQNDINAHDIRAAEIALADLINQIEHQGAHHVRGTCRSFRVKFSPAGVLIADMKALEAALDNSRLP